MKAYYNLKNRTRILITKTPRRKRVAACISILLSAALISFSIFATAPEAVTQVSREKAWPVSILSIKPSDLAPLISTYGKIEANNIAMLRTDVVAEIVAVKVKEGQWVDKGDVLVELRKDELALKLADQKADLLQKQAIMTSIKTENRLLRKTTDNFKSVYQLSQKKLKRYEDLFEKKMISQSVYDEVVQQANQQSIAYQMHMRQLADFPNQLAQQKALIARVSSQVKRAELNYDKAEITAPFSGPVLEVSAAVGGYTSFSVPLVKLADAEAFEIRAPIPGTYIERFREYLSQNKNVNATTAINHQQYTLRLTRLSRNVKAGSSGLDAFFRIEGTKTENLPEIGRVVDLKVVLPLEPEAIALPVQSIYENDRIYRVEDNRLQAVNIERIGDYETPDGQYRVLVRSESLHSGEQIITTQLPRAISGLLVEPIGTGDSGNS
jgi:multidrug efflux pump subunit AcrA (membrane-fusion protein)